MPRKCKKNKKKKPKFLSLRLNLSPENTQMGNSASVAAARRQLNLNQNPAEEETAAADFFAAAVDGCEATLAALFGGSPSDRSELSPSRTGEELAQDCKTRSPSLTYAGDLAHDSETLSPSLTRAARDMFRGAMRRGSEGREEREEKWVCYDEVTSCAADVRVKVHPQRLSLKLDYQDIIDAWCDKGPLYMPGPQTVPDLCDDFLSFGTSDGLNDGWRSNGSLWTVPENTVGKEGVKVEQEPEGELKIRHREASVLRYKEKRQNRLFSKRIRYEVRKINAEKRPRMKGRFVKRN